MEPRDGSERACLEQMCQEFLNARTPMEILSSIDNLNPDQDDDAGAQPVDMHVGDSSRLQQMIILPGEVEVCLRGVNLSCQNFVLKKS